MLRVYDCVTQHHDLRLVLVAALICLLASWTMLSLLRRAADSRGSLRETWLGAAAVVAGCGIWATHFISMIAFAPGLPIGFDSGLTALSILVAVALAGLGFRIARRGGAARLLGGGVVGAGVGAMHFTGMAALRVAAERVWDPGLVAAALLLGATLGALSVRTALAGQGRGRTEAAAALMTLGICAAHFTGMSALGLQPSPLLPGPDQPFSALWLALGVALAALVVLGAAGAGLAVDQHLAHRAAREAARLHALVDANFEGIIIHAGGTILDVNASLAGLLDRDREELIGRSLLELVPQDWTAQVGAGLRSLDPIVQEAEMLTAAGDRIPVELLGRRIDYHGGQARVVAVRDIRERRQAEERIRHLAYHDALTGLPNRALFREHAERALARVRRGDDIAVLCLDLDRFKAVNDTLGHGVGDALLQGVAARLLACTREADLAARLGGDEFAIVQEHCSQPADATALARRIVEAMAAPFDIAGHQVSIGTSIGIALAGDGRMDVDALLKSADLALYRAKADGRGTWRFFEPEMDARMRARRLLELDLRQALSLGQLELFYQPLAEASGRLSGFEALLRWHHPGRGLLLPADFIPLAEETGLIGPIGAWVLHQACLEVAGWSDTLKVAVNLSPTQFRGGGLASDVARALSESGLHPARLELEVTESLLMSEDDEALATLHALRELGVRIALDDFGTGCSSLGYLRRFPFDKIKIDRSFVRGIGQQEGCTAVVRAVIGLGRSLGMFVNAEGVETEEELAALRHEGCDEIQGYLLSRPRSAAEIAALLDAWTPSGLTEPDVAACGD